MTRMNWWAKTRALRQSKNKPTTDAVLDYHASVGLGKTLFIYDATLITTAQSPDDGARSVILPFAAFTELVCSPVLGLIHVTV